MPIRKTPQRCSEGNRETSVHFSKQRSRSFCFANFNIEKLEFSAEMNYLCFSPEICPETKKHHWQSFVNFREAKTISAASKCLSKNQKIPIFVKLVNGTAQQNRTYCGATRYEKDGKIKEANPLFEEFGEIPSPGARTDLNAIKTEIFNGKSVDEICVENPIIFHQYGRTLEKLETISLRNKFRSEMTKGIWYYGESGTGKSHKAFENYNPKTHYVLNVQDNGWWDGYNQQETVIINDFRGQIPYDQMLNLVDKFPYTVPRRNREPIPFISKVVIVTSPLRPEEVYNKRHANDNILQLSRRFDVIEMKYEKP